MTTYSSDGTRASGDVRALQERVRAFVNERVIPLEVACEHDPGSGSAAVFPPAIARLRDEAREQGLWNLFLTHSAADYAPLCEQMGRSLPAPHAFNCAAPDTGNAEILHRFGTDEQRAVHLDPLLDGRTRSCFAMTEPDVAGSDPVSIETSATRRPGGGWTIEGRKWFTTGAQGAATVIVMAVTDASAPRHERATLFVLPADTPGVRIVRSIPVLGHDGFPGHCELRFERCVVPDDAVLGEVGTGFSVAQTRLSPGRLHHCMRAIGHAERALELLCERARARVLRGRPLADRQLVQELVAQSRVEIEQSRALVRAAAQRLDAVGGAEAAPLISLAKLSAPATAQRAVDRAIQVHGALGVSGDSPLSALSRDARTLRLVDGADEVHLTVVARAQMAGEWASAA
ncbi:acyl-CoA dehydrogenase family protein [Conexibacter sp. CPCC 206217]|uniref:acyl-CoA dehydrogenase family protein n=1 Tax=Conexibacter sp. CPCC 206217 TaxID=3064574 RepID=UPI002725E719|nr:acyl-CoA dehydrogenase family protein [Conexibacter sp. CPCC 206217]MDO8211126.1 acyl-CoA dehydrogenase family protein [Conexibacter sp. CPCC 206217]